MESTGLSGGQNGFHKRGNYYSNSFFIHGFAWSFYFNANLEDQMREKFIALLKSHKAEKRFFSNAKTNEYNIDISPKEGWLSASFIWDKTIEGHEFWKKIAEEWFFILLEEDRGKYW